MRPYCRIVLGALGIMLVELLVTSCSGRLNLVNQVWEIKDE